MRLYILLDEALREASRVLGWVLSSSTGLLHAFAVTSQWRELCVKLILDSDFT